MIIFDVFKPKIIIKREEGIQYTVDSFGGWWWIWTNKNAEDFRIARCPQTKLGEWVDFVPAKNGVLVGGLTFLKNWIIRGEVSDALQKIFIRNWLFNK